MHKYLLGWECLLYKHTFHLRRTFYFINVDSTTLTHLAGICARLIKHYRKRAWARGIIIENDIGMQFNSYLDPQYTLISVLANANASIFLPLKWNSDELRQILLITTLISHESYTGEALCTDALCIASGSAWRYVFYLTLNLTDLMSLWSVFQWWFFVSL